METVLSIFAAILALLFMITVHEFGHYLAGKCLGFSIEEFSVGFGPKLISGRRKSGELFSLRLIPLGGYCAFTGEDAEADDPRAFNNQKPWKRLIVQFAGAFTNFVISLLLVILLFLIGGIYFPSVDRVLPDGSLLNSADSPLADSASTPLQAGDLLVEINGHFLYLNGDLAHQLAQIDEGQTFSVRILRNGQSMVLEGLTKRSYVNLDENGNVMYQTDDQGNFVLDENGEKIPILGYGLGIVQASGIGRLGFFESIGRAVVYAFRLGWAILGVLGQLLTGAMGLSAVGGPITTITMTAQIARTGFRNFMEIVCLLGVNLAVFNLLPIPALDGSRMIFTAIEWIRGKPVKRSVEAAIHTVGLLALLAFVILADVYQFFG